MVDAVVLPPAPAGSNVFLFYEEPIKRLLYLKPTAGFRARLVVIIALSVAVLAFSITYSVCQFLIRRRAGTRWWLWKRVERKAGSFIITNTMAGKEMMGLWLPVFATVQAVLVWRAFFGSGVRMSTVVIWQKIGLWPCLFIVIWHGLFANLHVYLQLRDDTTGPLRFLNARVANALFVGGGALGTVTLAGTVIASSVIASVYTKKYSLLVTYVVKAAAAWKEGDDVSAQQAVIRALWAEFEHTLARHLRLSGIFWGVTCIFYVVIFIVNLAAFPLIVSLRRQIRASLEDLQPQTIQTVRSTASLSPVPAAESDAGELIVGPSRRPSAVLLKPHSSSKVPTLSEVKAMAGRQSAGLEGAKRLRSMERSAKDLEVQSIAAIVLIVAQIGFASFFAHVYSTITSRGWWVTELVLFGPLWAVLVPVLGAFAGGLTWNAIQEARGQMVEAAAPKRAPSQHHNMKQLGSSFERSVSPSKSAKARSVHEKRGWVDDEHEDDALPLGLLPTIVVRATDSVAHVKIEQDNGDDSDASQTSTGDQLVEKQEQTFHEQVARDWPV